MTADDPLFCTLRIGSLTLPNRVALAPMTRVSAEENGCPTPRMVEYYRDFAAGGFSLLVTEGIYTDQAYAQCYLHQPGLACDLQLHAWRPIVDAVHASGSRVIAQLMHGGALSQGNSHRPGTRGPSAQRPKGQQLAFYRGAGDYAQPEAMTLIEIAEAISGFAQAAVRAKAAGFDGVEIHGANGYLLDQFFTQGVNLREDDYGGDVVGRLRLTIEVIQAVRAAVGNDYVVGVRISQGKVNDFLHKWVGGETEADAVFRTLSDQPLDYVHTTEFEAWQPAFGQGPSLATIAKRNMTATVIANGSLHEPERARRLIAGGEADMISLGRGALANADWPLRVVAGQALNDFDRAILSPIADLANADRLRDDRKLVG